LFSQLCYRILSLKTRGVVVPVKDKKQLVLVMDDEPLIHRVTTIMLENLGYDVIEALDGEEAVSHFEQGRAIAAFILDMTVPGGLGAEATLARLKQAGNTAPVIISSGNSYDPQMLDYADYGFAGALPKPFNLEQLSQVLLAALS
jgi:two-component system cell cycle sensor histidine kinase/response regulator CckA